MSNILAIIQTMLIFYDDDLSPYSLIIVKSTSTL